MLVVGIICLLGAAGLAFLARSQARRLRQMRETDTLTCGAIADLHRAAVQEGGPGSFAHSCEIVGVAAPGEGGPLRAPESGEEAVWHRVTVTEHYWDWQRDSDGDRRRVRRRRELTDQRSDASFTVDDGTGRMLVAPEGAAIDHAPKTFDRFVEDRQEAEAGAGALAQIAGAISRWTDDTIGFQREEWSIRPGARLYVIGEVSDRGGRLELAKGGEGRFVVSTRSEAQLQTSAKRWSGGLAIAAGVLALAGVVLVVLGLVA